MSAGTTRAREAQGAEPQPGAGREKEKNNLLGGWAAATTTTGHPRSFAPSLRCSIKKGKKTQAGTSGRKVKKKTQSENDRWSSTSSKTTTTTGRDSERQILADILWFVTESLWLFFFLLAGHSSHLDGHNMTVLGV